MQFKLDWTAILAVAGLGGLAYLIWKYNPVRMIVETTSQILPTIPSETKQTVQTAVSVLKPLELLPRLSLYLYDPLQFPLFPTQQTSQTRTQQVPITALPLPSTLLGGL